MIIGGKTLGYDHPTFIIAEACSNITRYLASPYGLRNRVKEVAETGATAIKLQLFKHTHFPKSEWESKKRVEFPRERVEEFADLCTENGLLWGASVFDEEAVDLCVELQADFLKLATREWNNSPLLSHCLESKLPLIRSYDWTSGKFHSLDSYVMMACVPRYPAFGFRVPSYLLDMAKTDDAGALIEHDPILWGWSSHTSHTLDCVIAVSRYASVIEKHVRFNVDDYEAGHSLSVTDFAKMVRDIREVEGMR